MEIEVGEYVRTESGQIYKLSYYNEEENRWISVTNEDWFPVYTSEIAKHSKNIIDLIEVGDYVDGYLINIKDDNGVYHGAYDCYDEVHFTDVSQIKNIVTKEQFESVKYKVGG